MNNGIDKAYHQERPYYDSDMDIIMDSIPYAQVLPAQDNSPAEGKLLTNPKVVRAFLDTLRSDMYSQINHYRDAGYIEPAIPSPPFTLLFIGATIPALMWWC